MTHERVSQPLLATVYARESVLVVVVDDNVSFVAVVPLLMDPA